MQTITDITQAQRFFASFERATPGVSGPLGTFFYKDTPYGTMRFLVDPAGRVLESTSFRRGW